jgi:chlorophyllase
MLRGMTRGLGWVLLFLAACGAAAGDTADGTGTGSSGGTGTETTGGATSGGAATGTTGAPGETGSGEATAAATGESTAAATTGEPGSSSSDTGEPTTTGGGEEVHDPDLDGPWEIAELEGSIDVEGVAVAIDCFYPAAGPTAGPFPVVVVAHGFQLPPTQYTSYVKRLATHGYVALTADFKAELFGTDHSANARQVVAGIDWAADEPALAGLADTNNVGLTGHSLGGKLAVFGATFDERVRASVTLDPVDGAQMCDADLCPDVTDMLPLEIPLGFVGETLDASGGFMPCAPEADNFLSFFAAASGPALAVTVHGANHMSFLDDVASCGFTCGLCQMATLDDAKVNRLARAYVVAFYGRYLKGEAGYETFLTGAAAQTRYVDPGIVTLAEK